MATGPTLAQLRKAEKEAMEALGELWACITIAQQRYLTAHAELEAALHAKAFKSGGYPTPPKANRVKKAK